MQTRVKRFLVVVAVGGGGRDVGIRRRISVPTSECNAKIVEAGGIAVKGRDYERIQCRVAAEAEERDTCDYTDYKDYVWSDRTDGRRIAALQKLAKVRGRLLKIESFSVHLGIFELRCVCFSVSRSPEFSIFVFFWWWCCCWIGKDERLLSLLRIQ